MKTGKFVLMMVILMTGATAVFAQGWRTAGQPGYVYGYGPGACVNVLPGITEEQKTTITELVTSHQTAMVEWRVKQRSTIDPIERNSIQGEILKLMLAHRNDIRNVLTEEQQKQFDLMQTRGFYGRGGFAPRGRGPCGQAGFGGRGGRGFRGGW